MSAALTIIYDDRVQPPAEIDTIIGAARFSDILHRRVSIGEAIRKQLRAGGATDILHLLDDRDAHQLAATIESSPTGRIFLWLPSCLVPTVPTELAKLVARAPYALQSVLAADISGGLAPSILSSGDALAILRSVTDERLQECITAIAQTSPPMIDHCGFVDLRNPAQFLEYLSGATETRHFNSLRSGRGTYTKSSTDRAKMAREHGLFDILPAPMRRFFLPTFDFFDDGKTAGYSMERLAVPDAALQLIHRSFDETTFGNLLDRFFDFIGSRAKQEVGSAGAQDVARQSILRKMNERIGVLLASPIGAELDAVLKASGPLGGIETLLTRAQAVITRFIELDRTSFLVVGHGDACLSNILFDRRTSLMRLIDPRGAKSLEDAWMHPSYDLAKFSHSIIGGYDFVNNELFDCSLDANLKLDLRLDGGGPPALLQSMFSDRLAAEGYDFGTVRAYELSLFLSMLPLHTDHPRKLAGFSLVAARIIQDLEGKL